MEVYVGIKTILSCIPLLLSFLKEFKDPDDRPGSSRTKLLIRVLILVASVLLTFAISLEGNSSKLEQDKKALSKDIAAKAQVVMELRTKVSMLESSVSSKNSIINKLENQLAGSHAALVDRDREYNILLTKNHSLEAKVDRLKTDLLDVKEELSDKPDIVKPTDGDTKFTVSRNILSLVGED